MTADLRASFECQSCGTEAPRSEGSYAPDGRLLCRVCDAGARLERAAADPATHPSAAGHFASKASEAALGALLLFLVTAFGVPLLALLAGFVHDQAGVVVFLIGEPVGALATLFFLRKRRAMLTGALLVLAVVGLVVALVLGGVVRLGSMGISG